jgi:RNA polymerase sigma-70 factor (ECF subfamily)
VTVNEHDGLAARFEAHRDHLGGIAHRMLGSLSEADDAVQEAWLRLARVDSDRVENLGAWLTTAVSRVCLDVLRSRRARREELLGEQGTDGTPVAAYGGGPEDEALLVDEVGRALLVVPDRLGPAERVALLHDMFGLPFDEIATVVERSPVAAKKLASRGRHRVRGSPAIGAPELARHRQVIEAFLAASRAGDVDAVVAVLAPDVVRRADQAALPAHRATKVHGDRAVADEIVVFGRNSQYAAIALVNGQVGLVVAPGGHLQLALSFSIDGAKIVAYELIADPGRLQGLDLAVIDG